MRLKNKKEYVYYIELVEEFCVLGVRPKGVAIGTICDIITTVEDVTIVLVPKVIYLGEL